MYPFERFLYTLKQKARHKARVEVAICEAYIAEETVIFCSHYFEPDVKVATTFVLMNCDEVQPYMNFFFQTLKEEDPRITNNEIEAQINDRFNLHHDLKIIGVCIKGTNCTQAEYDFYNILQEIVELEYLGVPVKRVVLFKCYWFDPTPNHGTKFHPQYGTVEVHASQRKFFPLFKGNLTIHVTIGKLPLPIIGKCGLKIGRQRKYKWLPPYENDVKRIWNTECQEILRGTMYSVRQNLFHKQVRPKWIPHEVMKQLESLRTSPEYLSKCEIAAANRASSKGGTQHKGGSIPNTEHNRRMVRLYLQLIHSSFM
ncbi:hypothetical protein K1719_037504 [Acacia pycnantha]|nr:hypothetical protein K1719_037504 [Acacia pycnantha]